MIYQVVFYDKHDRQLESGPIFRDQAPCELWIARYRRFKDAHLPNAVCEEIHFPDDEIMSLLHMDTCRFFVWFGEDEEPVAHSEPFSDYPLTIWDERASRGKYRVDVWAGSHEEAIDKARERWDEYLAGTIPATYTR